MSGSRAVKKGAALVVRCSGVTEFDRFRCPSGAGAIWDSAPRVALVRMRGLRFTRGNSPAPRWGEEFGFAGWLVRAGWLVLASWRVRAGRLMLAGGLIRGRRVVRGALS